MLKITITVSEQWDNEKNEFVYERYDVELEHSLVALSKWESEFERPFLGKEKKTSEEVVGYVRCMNLTPDIPPDTFNHLSEENAIEINKYIDARMTGTTVFEPKSNQSAPKETISSELIYYWLTSYQIPWEAQHWHLNRLFSLIRVFNAKNADPKKNKMTKAEMMEHRRQLNEKRRREMGTSG